MIFDIIFGITKIHLLESFKDIVYDECHYGTPFTALHADTIEICEETCNVSIFVIYICI